MIRTLRFSTLFLSMLGVATAASAETCQITGTVVTDRFDPRQLAAFVHVTDADGLPLSAIAGPADGSDGIMLASFSAYYAKQADNSPRFVQSQILAINHIEGNYWITIPLTSPDFPANTVGVVIYIRQVLSGTRNPRHNTKPVIQYRCSAFLTRSLEQ
jgi:hypothetical protein